MDEILDTSTFSISDFILDIPKDIKVTKNDERWYIQRQIETILNAEDMRLVNRKRYNEFLKENKYHHNEQSIEENSRRFCIHGHDTHITGRNCYRCKVCIKISKMT